jgi:hypothetical protein
MIAGIILFAITIFVHRHSYEWGRDEEPIALPRWLYWTMLLIALVPILNVVCFVIGAGVYIGTWANADVFFRYEVKWWTKMWEFLNKDV